MEVIGQSPALQGLCLGSGGGKILRGSSVEDIDGVHIVDQLHHLVRLHKVGQPSAELSGKVEFSVGKGARAAETAHGVTDGAVDTFPDLAGDDGAAAVIDVLPLVQGQNIQSGTKMGQLIGGEDPRFAAAQNGDIVIARHKIVSFSAFHTPKLRKKGALLH